MPKWLPAGAEVDLVIEREDDILGVEIKSGRGVSRADTRGLSSLEKTVGAYKPVNKWLLYAGPHRQLLDNSVLLIPYLDALNELKFIELMILYSSWINIGIF